MPVVHAIKYIGTWNRLQCELHSVCFNDSSCVNTSPGFQCRGCPRGYTGHYSDGQSYASARTFACSGRGGAYTLDVTQSCVDVDECASNNGRCDVNAHCQNTAVSTSVDGSVLVCLCYCRTIELIRLRGFGGLTSGNWYSGTACRSYMHTCTHYASTCILSTLVFTSI